MKEVRINYETEEQVLEALGSVGPHQTESLRFEVDETGVVLVADVNTSARPSQVASSAEEAVN